MRVRWVFDTSQALNPPVKVHNPSGIQTSTTSHNRYQPFRNLLGPMRKQRRSFLTRATPKRLPGTQCLRPCRICKAQDPQTNSQPTQKGQKTTSQPITGCQFSPLALHAARRKGRRTRAEVAEVARRSSKSGALMAWDPSQELVNRTSWGTVPGPVEVSRSWTDKTWQNYTKLLSRCNWGEGTLYKW